MTAAVTHCMVEHRVPLQNIFLFERKFVIAKPKGYERLSDVSSNLFPRCPLCFPLGSLTQPLSPIWCPKVLKGTERLHREFRMKWASLLLLFSVIVVFTSLITVGWGSRWKMYVSWNQSLAEEHLGDEECRAFLQARSWSTLILDSCWEWGLVCSERK